MTNKYINDKVNNLSGSFHNNLSGSFPSKNPKDIKKKSGILMAVLPLAACGGGSSGGGGYVTAAPPASSNAPPASSNGLSLTGTSLTKGSLTDTTSTLFDRTLDVYGVKLLVGGASGDQDAVPDAWAHKVAQSYVMLMDPTGTNINVAAQENMKKILAGEDGTWHEGIGTAQRILKGTGSEYPLNPLADFDEGELDTQYGSGTEALLSGIMQDMVWYKNSTGTINSGDGDITELYEHVMHTLHPWGVRGAVEGSAAALNYTKVGSVDPHDAKDSSWKTSELYLAMKEAIDNDVFDPSGYATDPLNDPRQFQVSATEYTYILNFSMWEMGKEFWSDKVNGEGALEGEWSLTASDPAGVLSENPLGHALFMKYFDPVLSKPDFATLRSMFQDDDQGAPGYDTVNGTEGIDSLIGGDGMQTINALAGNDILKGGAGTDSLDGGAGADNLYGEDDLDTFILEAGDSVLSFGGTGDAGTVTGYDTIHDFDTGNGTFNSETIDTVGTASVVANSAGTDGTDSTLTISGATIKSHAITDGVITFDDADVFAGLLDINTNSEIAAALDYLQNQDLGNAGATVTLDVGSDAFLFTQGDDAGTDNLDVLVRLEGAQVDSLITTNGTGEFDLYIL